LEAVEAWAWRCIDVSPEMAQTADRIAGWAEELGAFLAKQRGLREHMYSTYPELTRRCYPELTEKLFRRS
jgi:hypothetical protein